MIYYISLPILVVLYFLGLFLLRFVKNQKIANICFCASIFVLYITTVIIAYIKNGLYDWNFLNTLPTANVSPFMFFFCPLVFVLPKSWKPYFKNLIALLSVGMFLSPVASIVFNGMRNYSFHFSFYLDYIGHLLLSLWGCYFILTKQVELSIKKSIISGTIIVVVAIIMLLLNVIFKTAFFGLALDDKYNIYNAKIVGNAYLSALLYFVGLIVIMAIGYLYQKLVLLVDFKIANKREKTETNDGK